MELSRNSLWVQLCTKYGGVRYPEEIQDICSLVSASLRAVLYITVHYLLVLGTLIIGPIICIMGVVMTGTIDLENVGNFITATYSMIGFIEITLLLIAVGIFLLIAVWIWMVSLIVRYILTLSWKIPTRTCPGVVETWYKSFKEKTCILITYKD